MQERSTRSIKTTTLIRRFLPYFKKYRGMLVFDLVCAALTTVFATSRILPQTT